MFQIADDRFADFILNWKLLNSATLRAVHDERLAVPIEIAQLEPRYLTAA
jgi:hypothetical protein